MSVFLDAGVLLAFVLAADSRHPDAVRIVREASTGVHGTIFTSDYVLAEALNYVSLKRARHPAAEEIVKIVFGAEDERPLTAPILKVHGGILLAGIARYRKLLRERALSLTDCTTLELMDARGIAKIATFDSGFRGLVAEMVS